MNNITSHIETITPSFAATMLRNNPSNRNIRKRHVARLAAAMARGEWALNGEPIIVAADGRLIDGQHRLSAVVAAEVAVPMMVVRGVEPVAIHTIDTGAARTGGDSLSLIGVRNANHVAAVAKRVGAMARGDFSGKGANLTNAQVVRAVRRLPDIEGFVAGHMPLRSLCPSLPLFVGMMYALQYYGSTDRAQATARSFGRAVITGDCSIGTPAYALRERWLKIRLAQAGGASPGDANLARLQIRAWDHAHAGRAVSVLSIGRSTSHRPPTGLTGEALATLTEAMALDSGTL